MAYIRSREKKDGTVSYFVEIRRAGHKPKYVTYDNIYDAEQFVRKLETELCDEVQIPRHTDDEERLRKFYEEPLIDAINRFERSEYALDRHMHIIPSIKRHVGKVKFRQIKKSWLKSFVQKMRSTNSRRGVPYADQSIACMVQTLNVIAKWRADDMDLPDPRLPLSIEKMPGDWKVERNRRLSKDEERRLMERLRKIDRPNRLHWRILIQMALETGARQQELVGADWNEIDLDRSLWIIPKERTKTKEERAVPLTRKAVRMLKVLRRNSPDWATRVFEGLGRSSGCISTCFSRYARGAGLEDFHFHDLRHESASRMALYWRNFTIYELMLILGHSSIKMFKRYANLRGDELAAKLPGAKGATLNVRTVDDAVRATLLEAMRTALLEAKAPMALAAKGTKPAVIEGVEA